ALASRLHTVEEGPEPRLPQGPIFGGLPTDFRESWQMLFSDRYSVLALVQLIISSTLVLLFSILIPRYMQDVIGVPPESAAFVFAPTGIGALVGLRFLPWFTKIGKNRVVIIGLVVIGAVTDLVKVPAVLLIIAAVVAVVAFLSAKVTEREEQEAEARPPRRPSSERQEVGASGRFSEAEPGREHGTGEH